MLFGESTPAAEAERLLSQAAEAGATFFDTAEMYPVPQAAETQVRGGWGSSAQLHSCTAGPVALGAGAGRLTLRSWRQLPPARNNLPTPPPAQGRSEEILGAWLRRQPSSRDAYTVATKVAGPGGMDWLRGGPASLDGPGITAAIEGSLARLGTDHIDLLQLHWPDRWARAWRGWHPAPGGSSNACAQRQLLGTITHPLPSLLSCDTLRQICAHVW